MSSQSLLVPSLRSILLILLLNSSSPSSCISSLLDRPVSLHNTHSWSLKQQLSSISFSSCPFVQRTFLISSTQLSSSFLQLVADSSSRRLTILFTNFFSIAPDRAWASTFASPSLKSSLRSVYFHFFRAGIFSEFTVGRKFYQNVSDSFVFIVSMTKKLSEKKPLHIEQII